MPPLRACSISQYTPSTALHPLSSLRMPGRPRRVGEQPQCSPLVGHVRRQRHWARHAARWVAGAVLHTIPEEAEGAVVEVEEDAHAVAVDDDGRGHQSIGTAPLAIAEEAATIGNEPGGGAACGRLNMARSPTGLPV